MKALKALVLLLVAGSACAQEVPTFKFGKIAPTDFEKKIYSIDSNANAVVLANIGRGKIVGNTKGWFSIEFSEFKRIHILNKNGYHNADIELTVYSSSNGDVQLDNLKAITYNLENGKVVESKLEKANIYKEKVDKKYTSIKFTLPNVKEGSILEIDYKTTSDFIFSLHPWTFQNTTAPVLWSDYQISIPAFLSYAFLAQGYQPFYLTNKKDRTESFTVVNTNSAAQTERSSFTCGATEHRWVMKDVPMLKKESYTSTLNNHISKIEFQLSEFREPLEYKNILGSWQELSKDLLKHEYFGAAIDGGNYWLNDDVKLAKSSANNDNETARKVYAYIRDNFTCTDHSEVYTDQSLKTVVKNRKGNVAEINLLLVAMLRNAGIKTDPVILSTTDHGYTNPFYPLINRFNYVIARAQIDGKYIYLDASRPRLGYGKLPADCYNGHARVIDAAATPISFSADSLHEKKLTSINIINDEKGKWIGSFRQMPGEFESYYLRNKIKDEGKEAYFKEVKKGYGFEMELEHAEIDSLNNLDLPLTIHYDFDVSTNGEDILYINPMMGEGYKQNPFVSAERSYPVEMPYGSDETYVLRMEIPKGYVVDELPRQMKLKLDEVGESFFEYLLQQDGEYISMRSRIKLQRATYMPEEYEYLREFFKMVVAKQSEQIVLKKKNNP